MQRTVRNVVDTKGIVHAVNTSRGARGGGLWRKKCVTLREEGWIRAKDTHAFQYKWTAKEVSCLLCLAT